MTAAPKTSCSVAVIGAGAGGLVAARELRSEGHKVVVYEQGPGVGGVWAYTPATDSDLLGADPSRQRIHSSMYVHLRTNLPRELMAYSDFSFDADKLGQWSVDSRRFCSHREVYNYLQAFAQHHQLHDMIQFNTQVLAVRPAPGHTLPTTPSTQHHQPNGITTNGQTSSHPPLKWELELQQHSSSSTLQVFDAVVVCNGHYNEPNLPAVQGMQHFPGLQLHSHNYRQPDQFAGQTVLVVGASNSGEDISREVGSVAARVYLSARSWKNPAWAQDPAPIGASGNIYRRAMVSELHPDGSATFADGASVARLDAVIYCTGYRYSFPFLHPLGQLLSTSDQHVEPLYQHMFHPLLGPSLALVGLPWKVVPFPLMELQSKLVARLLSGRAQLPPPEVMQEEADAYIAGLEAAGVPLRYAHMMGDSQWGYMEQLACMCGDDVQPPEAWREAMYVKTGSNKRLHPETYRDVWD